MTLRENHNCKEELKSANLKVTPARLGVLQALEATTTPMDVTAILTYLENYNIAADPATVFRIMNSFTEKGIAKPIQFNEGKLRYEHTGRADHHHFICEKCGSIEDISACNISALEKDIQQKKGLLITHHSLEFFGICTNCQK